jgi:hypothetical protein
MQFLPWVIAFDSLLSESSPSPGRVLSERFALLAVSPEERSRRYKLFLKDYLCRAEFGGTWRKKC